jgi:uncharacterized caspase-like protein
LLAALVGALWSSAVLAQGLGVAPTAQLPAATSFVSEKKVAIVVGISDYPIESGYPRLQFAAKDAADLAAALQKQGYQTELLTDSHAMKSSIIRALQQAHDILSQPGAAGTGTILFAFSGHGGELVGKGNSAKQYLVTYDSMVGDAEPGFPLKDVADALLSSGAARAMMFVDACRDETGAASKGGPVLGSFQHFVDAQGMKILFSTAPGQQSFEDPSAKNGYFTHYLLQGLAGQAARPDGLVTFDGLASWVSAQMRNDPTAYQTPYWNQNASGDFYIAGGMAKKEALVVGVDQYPGHPLRSAAGGARAVNAQLKAAGFDTVYLENPTAAQLRAKLAEFGKDLGSGDVALIYFAGDGGIAAGMPFVMGAGTALPAKKAGGKWLSPPTGGIAISEVMQTLRRNHAGPNLYLLDMGLARASASDKLDLTRLSQEHSLVLFSCKPGQEPERTADGSLFSSEFVSVLKIPKMSAGYAVSRIVSAVFAKTNGVEYAIEVPMLPDRVYLTPSQ